MVAEDLINNMIPPLKPGDSAQLALNWMDKFRLNQLPIVDNGKFLGIISESDIFDSGAEALASIADIELSIEDATIKPFQHYYDIIKIATEAESKVLAVIDDEGSYLGVIPVKDTIPLFSQMSAMKGPGAILVLSMNERDYSLAEISRLIEENHVKVLSVHVSPEVKDTQKLRVTIKTNSTEISAVVATLERFGYYIMANFHADELLDGDNERLDLLFRYLNI